MNKPSTSNLSAQQLDSRIHIFDFHVRNALIRYGVIVLLALINAHIRQADFTDYSFPMRSFLNGLFFGGIICTSSWAVTLIVKDELFKNNQLTYGMISKFIISNLMVGIAVYTILYLLVFGPVAFLNFTAYLFITISIIIIENLAFILYSHLQENKNRRQKATETILVKTGRKKTLLPLSEISYAQVTNGIIRIFKSDQSFLNTQFKSLDHLEMNLKSDDFFRANRQTIISRNAVKEIKHRTNRKLQLQLRQPNDVLINVSRYKKKDLLDWIKK